MQRMDTTPTEGITQKVRSLSCDCKPRVGGLGTAAGLCAVGVTCAACCFPHKAVVGVGGCLWAFIGGVIGVGTIEFAKAKLNGECPVSARPPTPNERVWPDALKRKRHASEGQNLWWR